MLLVNGDGRPFSKDWDLGLSFCVQVNSLNNHFHLIALNFRVVFGLCQNNTGFAFTVMKSVKIGSIFLEG